MEDGDPRRGTGVRRIKDGIRIKFWNGKPVKKGNTKG